MKEEFSLDVDENTINELKKAIGYDEIEARHKRFMEGKETADDLINHIYHYEIKNDKGLDLDVVELKYYISDNEINSKEEIEEKYLEKILGGIDIALENIGYSEYTITGYDLVNFKLGGHDLEKIFSNYLGKYACIIVNKEDIKE